MGRVNMMLTDDTEKKLRFIMVQFNFKTFEEAIDNLCRSYVSFDYPKDNVQQYSNIDYLKKEESEKK